MDKREASPDICSADVPDGGFVPEDPDVGPGDGAEGFDGGSGREACGGGSAVVSPDDLGGDVADVDSLGSGGAYDDWKGILDVGKELDGASGPSLD